MLIEPFIQRRETEPLCLDEVGDVILARIARFLPRYDESACQLIYIRIQWLRTLQSFESHSRADSSVHSSIPFKPMNIPGRAAQALLRKSGQNLGVFPDDPRGHATLILHDGCLQWVGQLSAQFFCKPAQKRLVSQITL